MANGTPQATPVLTRAKLLAAKDQQPYTLDVPEWGGAVKVKRLSRADEVWIRKQAEDKDGLLDTDRELLLKLVRGVVQPQLKVEDLDALEQKSAYAIERVVTAIVGTRSAAEAELAVLTRAALLKAQDIREETINVPEWGGAIKIRVLSRENQVWVRESARGEDGILDEDRLDLYVILKGVAEPALELDDVEALMEKSHTVLERVSEEILAFSASTKKARVSPTAVAAAEARFLEGDA